MNARDQAMMAVMGKGSGFRGGMPASEEMAPQEDMGGGMQCPKCGAKFVMEQEEAPESTGEEME